jgi:hypothetical protein
VSAAAHRLVPVETHAGLRIYLSEEGYWAENGADSFGYHETLADIREEIDDYWQGTEHGPLNGYFTGADA